LVAFVAIGTIGSYLSGRIRKEASNAERRRAQAVAVQEQYRDLVNSVEGVVWEADTTTFAFSFVSDKAQQILGYPAEQWLTESDFWKKHIHPEDLDRAVECRQEAAAERRSYDAEYRMMAAGGKVVWMRDLATVVVEDGVATRLRGVMVDVTRRKDYERKLSGSAKLLDLTHDAIFVRDAESRITYWNRGAEELYGWPADQAIGKVTHELLKTFFPEPLEHIEEKLTRAGRWEGELVHTKRFGTPVIVASRWSLQRDEDGRPTSVLETNNDITEQKRVEQARQEIEEQWRAAFESNPTMYFIVDANGTTVSVNAFGAKQLGFTPDELIGQPVLNLFYEQDRAAVQALANEAFSRRLGQTMRWEARKVRKDGTILWVRETANAILLKKRPVMLVVCEDITEQKRAEEALKQSESNLAEAQRLTHTGSFVWDVKSGTASYLSDEWYRIYDFAPESGRAWHERLERYHPEDRGKWQSEVDRAIRQKSDYEVEYRIVLPDGTVKHLHAIGHPVLDAYGDVVQFMGSVTDITERKRAEQERERLHELEADLAHMNRVTTMGELTASLAHEINQPIAAAVTNANTCIRWLAGENPNIEEARETAGRIVKDANRAAAIISRIRLLFKKGPPQHELVDINDVIQEIVALLRNEATRYCVSIRAELGAGLPSLLGDRVQLQQVVMNLMINSIEAMKNSLSNKRELTVTSQLDTNHRLLVSVADTGMGLPANSDQIFDAFFTTKHDGTGMGLAISRSIIESHGGRLWASPNPNEGATFYFTVPVSVEASV
jgi:PAS domain S-box-containing protein